MRNAILFRVRFLMLLCLLAIGGCGPTMATTSGKVIFDDGAPYTDCGMVLFESAEGKPDNARAEIAPDGTFTLSTARPGDGVPPGLYKVCLTPRTELIPRIPNQPIGPFFDSKYHSFKMSNLTFEVKPGSNFYEIKVGLPIRAGK